MSTMTHTETPTMIDGHQVAVNWGGNTRHVVKPRDKNMSYGGTWDYHLAACGLGSPIYDPRDSRVPHGLTAETIESANWCKKCARKLGIELPDQVGDTSVLRADDQSMLHIATEPNQLYKVFRYRDGRIVLKPGTV